MIKSINKIKLLSEKKTKYSYIIIEKIRMIKILS